MGSTSISEIVEIKNSTKDTYFMYVWDDKNEGKYSPFSQDDWIRPQNGDWLEIGPGAHLRADECGIPDGGKSGSRDRSRVIFADDPRDPKRTGDPDRGVRINRVGTGSDHDAIVFRNNGTGEEVARITIPATMHQSLLLRISESDGVVLEQTDMAASAESQAQDGLKVFGNAMQQVGEILLEILKRAPAAL